MPINAQSDRDGRCWGPKTCLLTVTLAGRNVSLPIIQEGVSKTLVKESY
jgi:hypothetical protein